MCRFCRGWMILRTDGLKPVLLVGGLFWNSSGRGQKLIAVNARRNAALAVVGFHANDFREASNMHIASQRDFTGQCKNEFDGRSRSKLFFNQKVESAETHVSRLSMPFGAAGVRGSDRQRKRHRKSPRCPAFCRLIHQSPGRGRSGVARTT